MKTSTLICCFTLFCFNIAAQNCNIDERYQTGIVNGQLFAFVDANQSPYIMNGVNVRNAVDNNLPRYSQSQFDEILSKGFNSVRIPMDWKDFETSSGVFSTLAFDALDEVISRAEQAGLTVVLDPIHIKGDSYWNIPAWAWGAIGPASNRVWDELNAHAIPYLSECVTRYCSNSTVIAIDLVNEPREPNLNISLSDKNDMLINMYLNWVSILRQIDGNKIFLLEPFYGSASVSANNLQVLSNTNNIVWSVHDYYAGEGNSSNGFRVSGYAESNGNGGNRTESWNSSFPYPKNNQTTAIADMTEHINVHLNASASASVPMHIGEFGIPVGWSGKSEFLCDKRGIYTSLYLPIMGWAWNKDIDGGFGLFQPNPNGTGTWMTWSDPLVDDDCDQGIPIVIEPSTCNILENPSFENDQSSWYTYQHSSVSSSWNTSGNTANFNVTNGGADKWRLQLIQSGFTVEQGKNYLVYFKAKADQDKLIYYNLSNIQDNEVYEYQEATVTSSWQTFSFYFTMSSATDTNSRLNFGIGGNSTNISFDDIVLQELYCGCPNVILNSSFNNNLDNYTNYISSQASASLTYNAAGGYASFIINNGTTSDWRVQLKQLGIELEQGVNYTVSFRAKASSTKNIYLKLTDAGDTQAYHPLQNFDISNTWERYYYSFAMDNQTDPNATLNFGLGANNFDIDLDDIALQESACAMNRCENNLVHIGNTPEGIFQASDYILTTGTIANDNLVNYKSGNSINLDEGFSIEKGAVLDVNIEACNQ